MSRKFFVCLTLSLLALLWANPAHAQRFRWWMDEKFQRETPGLKALERTLDEVRSLLEKIVKEKRISEPYPGELATQEGMAEDALTNGQAGAAVGARLSTGAVRTRQEALNRLAEVAEYFRQTEPHSPISYLVQRAIKWGQMPLEAWLEDVIKDSSVLGSLRETLGIKNDFSDGSSES
jgi:type VI secretion system protein ImpA